MITRRQLLGSIVGTCTAFFSGKLRGKRDNPPTRRVPVMQVQQGRNGVQATTQVGWREISGDATAVYAVYEA